MALKVVQYKSGDQIRQIVAAMIFNRSVLGKIAAKWKPEGLFHPSQSKWANVVGSLCVKFYSQYHQSPKSRINGMVRYWGEKRNRDKTTVDAIEDFVGIILRETDGKRINPEYEIDIAQKHFDKVRFEVLQQDLLTALDMGDLEKADEVFKSHSRIELAATAGNFLEEKEIHLEACDRRQEEVMIEYKGALKRFFRNTMARDSFIVFTGPEKRGKCIRGDMEVSLSNGVITTIENIVKEKKPVSVITLNEETQRFESIMVSKFWNNGEKECWEVKTRTGRRVSTTFNHQYLTPDGWKLLKEVHIGDYIAVPKRLGFFGDQEIPEAELKFLAYMLADGCCTGGQPSFTKTDEILVKDFETTCDGLNIGHRRVGISDYLLGANPLLRRYGLWGHLSKNKEIPFEIFSCPRSQIALFLKVFFSCDGSIPNGKDGKSSVVLGLASKKMLKQIGSLLLRFGIVHKIRYKPTILNGKKFKAWSLDISSREYLNLFLREINFLSYKETEILPDKKSRSFLDKFPHQVARQFYKELEKEYEGTPVPRSLGLGKGKHVRKGHAFRAAFGKRQAGFIREQLAKEAPIMRQSFVHADPNSPAVRKYMDSDVLWDEVVSIRRVGKHQTYDIGVPIHHNFVANDCIVHNTWVLIDVAWRAMLQRRRVAFFAAGDMSRNQLVRRLDIRASRRPLDPKSVRIPKAIEVIGGKGKVAEYEYVIHDKVLSGKEAHAKYLEVLEKEAKSKGKLFRFCCHPSSHLSIETIYSTMEGWERDQWVPDVVVIDYADIMAMPKGKDLREQTNMLWEKLRGLSTEKHCLLVTATQASARSYKVDLLDRSCYSEDKRKYAHCVGMIGLNQTRQEKEDGIMRWNWLVLREHDFSDRRCCYVAGCLDIGNPAMKSVYPTKKEESSDEG